MYTYDVTQAVASDGIKVMACINKNLILSIKCTIYAVPKRTTV